MTMKRPDRLVSWFAGVFVPASHREEFVGDLLEEVGRGGRSALWVWSQLVLSVPALCGMRVRRRREEARALASAPVAAPASVRARTGAPGVFQTYLAAGHGSPRGPGGLALSLGLHVGVLALAIVAPWWRVEEVRPPEITLPIFVPRPPAAAPNAIEREGGGGGSKQRLPPNREKTAEKRPLVSPPPSPPETPPPEPAPAPPETPPADGTIAGNDNRDGIDTSATSGGGNNTGTGVGPCRGPGCATDGSDGGGGVATLPPSVASKRCVHCPNPSLPPALRRVLVNPRAVLEICADARGMVRSAEVLRGIDGAVDREIATLIRTWRFEPYTIDRHPIPFCYRVDFVFETR